MVAKSKTTSDLNRNKKNKPENSNKQTSSNHQKNQNQHEKHHPSTIHNHSFESPVLTSTSPSLQSDREIQQSNSSILHKNNQSTSDHLKLSSSPSKPPPKIHTQYHNRTNLAWIVIFIYTLILIWLIYICYPSSDEWFPRVQWSSVSGVIVDLRLFTQTQMSTHLSPHPSSLLQNYNIDGVPLSTRVLHQGSVLNIWTDACLGFVSTAYALLSLFLYDTTDTPNGTNNVAHSLPPLSSPPTLPDSHSAPHAYLTHYLTHDVSAVLTQIGYTSHPFHKFTQHMLSLTSTHSHSQLHHLPEVNLTSLASQRSRVSNSVLAVAYPTSSEIPPLMAKHFTTIPDSQTSWFNSLLLPYNQYAHLVDGVAQGLSASSLLSHQPLSMKYSYHPSNSTHSESQSHSSPFNITTPKQNRVRERKMSDDEGNVLTIEDTPLTVTGRDYTLALLAGFFYSSSNLTGSYTEHPSTATHSPSPSSLSSRSSHRLLYIDGCEGCGVDTVVSEFVTRTKSCVFQASSNTDMMMAHHYEQHLRQHAREHGLHTDISSPFTCYQFAKVVVLDGSSLSALHSSLTRLSVDFFSHPVSHSLTDLLRSVLHVTLGVSEGEHLQHLDSPSHPQRYAQRDGENTGGFTQQQINFASKFTDYKTYLLAVQTPSSSLPSHPPSSLSSHNNILTEKQFIKVLKMTELDKSDQPTDTPRTPLIIFNGVTDEVESYLNSVLNSAIDISPVSESAKTLSNPTTIKPDSRNRTLLVGHRANSTYTGDLGNLTIAQLMSAKHISKSVASVTIPPGASIILTRTKTSLNTKSDVASASRRYGSTLTLAPLPLSARAKLVLSLLNANNNYRHTLPHLADTLSHDVLGRVQLSLSKQQLIDNLASLLLDKDMLDLSNTRSPLHPLRPVSSRSLAESLFVLSVLLPTEGDVLDAVNHLARSDASINEYAHLLVQTHHSLHTLSHSPTSDHTITDFNAVLVHDMAKTCHSSLSNSPHHRLEPSPSLPPSLARCLHVHHYLSSFPSLPPLPPLHIALITPDSHSVTHAIRAQRLSFQTYSSPTVANSTLDPSQTSLSPHSNDILKTFKLFSLASTPLPPLFFSRVFNRLVSTREDLYQSFTPLRDILSNSTSNFDLSSVWTSLTYSSLLSPPTSVYRPSGVTLGVTGSKTLTIGCTTQDAATLRTISFLLTHSHTLSHLNDQNKHPNLNLQFLSLHATTEALGEALYARLLHVYHSTPDFQRLVSTPNNLVSQERQKFFSNRDVKKPGPNDTTSDYPDMVNGVVEGVNVGGVTWHIYVVLSVLQNRMREVTLNKPYAADIANVSEAVLTVEGVENTGNALNTILKALLLNLKVHTAPSTSQWTTLTSSLSELSQSPFALLSLYLYHYSHLHLLRANTSIASLQSIIATLTQQKDTQTTHLPLSRQSPFTLSKRDTELWLTLFITLRNERVAHHNAHAITVASHFELNSRNSIIPITPLFNQTISLLTEITSSLPLFNCSISSHVTSLSLLSASSLFLPPFLPPLSSLIYNSNYSNTRHLDNNPQRIDIHKPTSTPLFKDPADEVYSLANINSFTYSASSGPSLYGFPSDLSHVVQTVDSVLKLTLNPDVLDPPLRLSIAHSLVFPGNNPMIVAIFSAIVAAHINGGLQHCPTLYDNVLNYAPFLSRTQSNLSQPNMSPQCTQLSETWCRSVEALATYGVNNNHSSLTFAAHHCLSTCCSNRRGVVTLPMYFSSATDYFHAPTHIQSRRILASAQIIGQTVVHPQNPALITISTHMSYWNKV